jgi:hypothetical protein
MLPNSRYHPSSEFKKHYKWSPSGIGQHMHFLHSLMMMIIEHSSINDVVREGALQLSYGSLFVVGCDSNKNAIKGPNSTECYVKLPMTEDTVLQVNAYSPKGLALRLVDGHCES